MLLENLRLETVFPLLEVFTTPGYERSHSLDFLVLNLQVPPLSQQQEVRDGVAGNAEEGGLGHGDEEAATGRGGPAGQTRTRTPTIGVLKKYQSLLKRGI